MSSVLPRPAATILLLRDGPSGLEVWLMERSRSVGFMASAWVFPGGRVDDSDADLPGQGDFTQVPKGFWMAALRELEEEALVRIGDAQGYDPRPLKIWAHWITPEVEPRRYDTWFFAAALPAGQQAGIDNREAVNGAWFRPQAAVEQSLRGELLLAPPTLRCLQELSVFTSVSEALSSPRRTPPLCPRFALDAGEWWVLLPGDPEFPSDEAADPPTRFLIRGFMDKAMELIRSQKART